MIYGGIAVTTTIATLEYKFQECIEIVGNPAQITSPHRLFWLRLLFGRMRSRWIGAAFDIYLPVALRSPLYRLFAWSYDADIDEARYPLESYRNFNDFFCRTLREGVRPVADVPLGVVSPSDGKVMAQGVIQNKNARIEQVKGATYSVPAFLGLDPVAAAASGSTIHYAVIYLAPGNYHRIHSPCEVNFATGQHFCGELLPVREKLLRHMDDVFTVNERVVLSGKWKFGQMHVTMVGAANVGSIFLDFDPKLKTNRLRDITVHCGGDVSSKMYPEGVRLGAGDNLGGFRLGSTVVLVFEAPPEFKWNVGVGDSVVVGQNIGDSTH